MFIVSKQPLFLTGTKFKENSELMTFLYRKNTEQMTFLFKNNIEQMTFL